MKRNITQVQKEDASVNKKEKKKITAKPHKSDASEDDTMKSMCNIFTSKTLFLVGQEEEPIVADTYMLSNSSPVFKAMLCGEFKEKNPVKIPDVEPDAFDTMLRFINGEQYKFLNMIHAANVCYVADKYDLPKLKTACSHHLYPSSIDEIWTAINCAVLYNIDILKNGAIELICDSTYEVLESPQFLSLSRDALKVIVQEDDLNIKSEVHLITAVIYWAKHQCLITGKCFDQKNIRDALGDITEHIRFLTMTNTEVLKHGRMILSESEMEILLKCLNKESYTENINFLCCRTERRKVTLEQTPPHLKIHSIHFLQKTGVDIFEIDGPDTQELGIPFSMVLYNITISTRNYDMDGMYNRYYLEEVSVTVKGPNGEIVGSGKYLGKVKYNSKISVNLYTSKGKLVHLSSPDFKTKYSFTLSFAKKTQSYVLRKCNFSSFFKDTPDEYSFLIGFKYSL